MQLSTLPDFSQPTMLPVLPLPFTLPAGIVFSTGVVSPLSSAVSSVFVLSVMVTYWIVPPSTTPNRPALAKSPFTFSPEMV